MICQMSKSKYTEELPVNIDPSLSILQSTDNEPEALINPTNSDRNSSKGFWLILKRL